MANQTLKTLLALFLLFSALGCGENDDDKPQGQFTPSDIMLKESGELKELLDESLIFVDSAGEEWVAPRGTLTDGASVPRFALPITNGRWDRGFLKAAVVHDAYCQEENETRTPDQYRKRPWKAVHRMFYEACVAGGTDPLTAKSMFAAVWLFGPRWDDPDGELEQVSSDILARGYSGANKWIEQNDPTIQEIESDLATREPLLLELYRFEHEVERALDSGNTLEATGLLDEQEALLRKETRDSPEDPMLLIFQGYMHKHRAMLSRESGVLQREAVELSRSEEAFRAVIADNPRDPSALNGLGSVFLVRGELDAGERYVQQALTVDSNHVAARRELQTIQNLRIQRSNGIRQPERIERVNPP